MSTAVDSAMAFIYINMGAEMLYVLEQRLRTVGTDKAFKVLSDILTVMFHGDTINSYFSLETTLDRETTKEKFAEIAQSSIMRLNETSMDKLFDLMTMTLKYQLQMLVAPEHVLTLTANHLDGVLDMLPNNQQAFELVDNVHSMAMERCANLRPWEFALLRGTMLTFFQGCRVKVSILIREKKQNEEADFVYDKEDLVVSERTDSPGLIKYFDEGILSRSTSFPTRPPARRIDFEDDLGLGSLSTRRTELGRNMYRPDRGGQTEAVQGNGDEIKLLSTLITRVKDEKDNFALSLFDTEQEESSYVASDAGTKEAAVTRIDASKNKKSLNAALSDIKVTTKKKGKGEDLLDLFDEAGARPQTGVKKSAKKGGTDTEGRPASKKTTRPASKDGSVERPASKGGNRDRSASQERPLSKAGTATPSGSRPSSKAGTRPVSRSTSKDRPTTSNERTRSASAKRKPPPS